ncbi:RNA-binding KH domain-containing protein RCF3-like [Euphorbia lathyris]|uniref:RNA-binding KH domain-containing protein RCF3-like n=1 Tax=Euphorbia lathyris TaxID=212925 RepID=UPI003313234D
MDGNRRDFFKKYQTTQFKRKGVNRKGKWKNSSHEEPSGNSLPADTVYRILCPSRKIGGVIGKGGGIIKGLREETRAKITVADSFPGSDERVIIIYSSPEKLPRNQNKEEGLTMENEKRSMEPHCAAQDALLKVHDRIVEEDLFGGVTSDDDNENNVITARLLVPNNMVGCLLGKGGDVIQRLRSETGASIRVLPADHLPTCAMGTDELVQISAKPDVAKRALYEVSTLLHQNPRKDQSPSVSMPYGGPSFHTPRGPMAEMLPPGNRVLSHRISFSHNTPPMPLMGGYSNQAPGFGPGGFCSGPPGHGGEPSAEFSLKILCSDGKIGGVIGKGGSNVKLVQQETGASIHVQDASAESNERVIRISAFEALWNPRSETIDAILQLQNKTSEVSEKGTITTRLLVPSSKVGCILGQGGQIINEMRRRTQADIRVYSKDEKPKCASEDEELVQISGNFIVAKDALAEIATRLRVRTLRDANPGTEPGPLGRVQGFGPTRSLPGRNPQLSDIMGAGSSGGYEAFRGGGLDYESQSYPDPTAIRSRYPNPSGSLEINILNNGVHSRAGAGAISAIGEAPDPRVKLQDSRYGVSENLVEFRGSSDRLNAAQNILHPFSSSGQSMNSQQGSYQNMTAQQNSYQNTSGRQNQSMYQGMNTQQSPSYRNMNVQQSPYGAATAQQGAYTNISAPLTAYNNISTQQGTYHY